MTLILNATWESEFSDQVLSDLIDVLRHDWVSDELRRSLDLLGDAFSHIELSLQAVPISETPAAPNVAVTNGFDVANAVIMVAPGGANLETRGSVRGWALDLRTNG